MTCPDWLILSAPEKIMMLFSLFGMLLLLNLLVFWRSRVSANKSAGIDGINACLLRLAAPVITPSIARMINYSFSTPGNFPRRWKTLKLTLCSKKVMQVTHLIIVQFLSLQSYLLWRLLNVTSNLVPRVFLERGCVTSTILCMTFFKWTTWFILDSPVFVSTMVPRLPWLKKLMGSY